MIPRRIFMPVGVTAALVFLGWALPQPDLQVACYVASFLTAIWVVIALYRDRGPAPRSMLEDDKHIVLFKEATSYDSATCPHCGEVIGLGVPTCPRCKRSTG